MANKNFHEIEKRMEEKNSDTDKRPYSLEITCLRDFKKMKLPKADFLIEQFVPEIGITMVHGSPGAFKTFLVLQMIADIVNGAKFLGKFATKMVKVLIINLDDIPVQLQKRFDFLKISDSPEKDVYTTYADDVAFDINNDEQRNLMIGKAKELGIGLIVIDTLRQCHRTRENESDDMTVTMDNLKTLSKATGAAVVFCHHNAKSTFGLSGALQASGSHVIAGSCVSSIGLKAQKEETIQMDQGKSKLCERLKNVITLKFSVNSYPLFTIDENQKQKASDEDIKANIITFFSDNPMPGLTKDELTNQHHKTWNTSKSKVKKALTQLEDEGYLEIIPGGSCNRKILRLSQEESEQK